MINYQEKGAGLGDYLASFNITLSEVYDDGTVRWECSVPNGLLIDGKTPADVVNEKIEEYNPWATEKSKKFNEINEWLENQIALILSDIPQSERSSWPTQVAEARGLQPISMLASIARRRGITVDDLKAKVLYKEQLFSSYYGEMQGERDRIETLVKSFPDEGSYERLPELWSLHCSV